MDPLMSRSIIAIAACLVNKKLPVDRGHRHRAVERGQVLLQDAPGVQAGGVVDHDVDPAPRVEHRLDVRQHVGLDADVTGQRQPCAAVALDPPHGRLRRLQVQVVARHPRAVARERQRDPAADVRPGPGDQRHLPVKRNVQAAPLCVPSYLTSRLRAGEPVLIAAPRRECSRHVPNGGGSGLCGQPGCAQRPHRGVTPPIRSEAPAAATPRGRVMIDRFAAGRADELHPSVSSALGSATAPGAADAVLVIRLLPVRAHDI